MGTLPNLAATFADRFTVHPGAADEIQPTEPRPSQGLERPLVPRLMFTLHHLSPVAKIGDHGEALQDFPYELPPQPITHLLISQYHATGVAAPGQMPFKLRAVGLVNPYDIARGVKGFVSTDFQIVP